MQPCQFSTGIYNDGWKAIYVFLIRNKPCDRYQQYIYLKKKNVYLSILKTSRCSNDCDVVTCNTYITSYMSF